MKILIIIILSVFIASVSVFGEYKMSRYTIDSGGISFAAIQGLYEIVQEKDVEITQLKERTSNMEALLANLIEEQKGGQK